MSIKRVFVTGDLRLGDATAINEYNRPFKNVWDMDYTIINNWNKVITNDDNVVVIGDFFRNPSLPIWEYLDYMNYGNLAFLSNRNNISLFDNTCIKKLNPDLYCFAEKELTRDDIEFGKKYFEIIDLGNETFDTETLDGKTYSFIYTNRYSNLYINGSKTFDKLQNSYSEDRIVFSNIRLPATTELPKRLCNVVTDKNNFSPINVMNLI